MYARIHPLNARMRAMQSRLMDMSDVGQRLGAGGNRDRRCLRGQRVGDEAEFEEETARCFSGA